MSPFWILLQQRMMEAVMSSGATRCAKLQSNRDNQQTNTQLFYRQDALPVTQPTVSKHRKEQNLSGCNLFVPSIMRSSHCLRRWVRVPLTSVVGGSRKKDICSKLLPCTRMWASKRPNQCTVSQKICDWLSKGVAAVIFF